MPEQSKHWLHFFVEILIGGGMLALMVDVGWQFVCDNWAVIPQGDFQTGTGELALAYYNPATRNYQVYEAFFTPTGAPAPTTAKRLDDPPYVLRFTSKHFNKHGNYAMFVPDFFIEPRSQSIFVVRITDRTHRGECVEGTLLLKYADPDSPEQIVFRKVCALYE